ncbi:MAG: hypothetical protein EOO11_21885 [Chitinophagaceae bacterium]|nr:MAG: hypothetical protein EOO11_21885 [Chitinophagaceae bacterium]
MNQRPPIDVAPLLPVLDAQLLELLRSLTPEEWSAPTIAPPDRKGRGRRQGATTRHLPPRPAHRVGDGLIKTLHP